MRLSTHLTLRQGFRFLSPFTHKFSEAELSPLHILIQTPATKHHDAARSEKLSQPCCAISVALHVPPMVSNARQTYSEHQNAKCVANKESFRTTNLAVIQKITVNIA